MSAATPITRGNFIPMLFSVLERAGIRYCVLHGWEELPETVSSDLDLAVHPQDFAKLQIVFPELAAAGYKWIQCRNYAACGYRFDFAWFEGSSFHIVGVDCIHEYRYAGLILRSGEELLKDRRQYHGFWIASNETVFAYLLMKKSLKGAISASQLLELREISAEIGSERSLAIASEVFGEKNGARVVAAIADQSLPAMLPKLRSQLKRTVLKRNPWKFVRSHIDEKLRLVKRWFQPTGLMLIALGPDGVGKSTTLVAVVKNLKPAFREVYFFHYRAPFGKRPNTPPVTHPHAKSPRGPILSAIRGLLFFMQFWVSYLVSVRPKLGRSGLVVFDRYFHDLLVDHWRYRYSGPQWFPRLLLRLMPAKNVLLLVLDAEESVIRSRKQEIPVEHLRELRRGYLRLVSDGWSAVLIHTDQAPEDTTTDATEAVYQHLLSRWSRRYPQWTKGYVSSQAPRAASAGRAS